MFIGDTYVAHEWSLIPNLIFRPIGAPKSLTGSLRSISAGNRYA